MVETAKSRIEKEFDEPLRDVIAVMRKQKFTWRTIALALGVSRSRVYQFRQEAGLAITGRRQIDELSQYSSKLKKTAQRLGYRDARSAIVDLRTGGLTVQETAKKLGVSPRTIRRNYPRGFAGTVFIKTELYERTRNRGGNWGFK